MGSEQTPFEQLPREVRKLAELRQRILADWQAARAAAKGGRRELTDARFVERGLDRYGIKFCVRTLGLWATAFKSGGVAGLVDQRKACARKDWVSIEDAAERTGMSLGHLRRRALAWANNGLAKKFKINPRMKKSWMIANDAIVILEAKLQHKTQAKQGFLSDLQAAQAGRYVTGSTSLAAGSDDRIELAKRLLEAALALLGNGGAR